MEYSLSPLAFYSTKVKDIENALLERTAELREARAQLASLKKTLASLTQTRVENTSSEGMA